MLAEAFARTRTTPIVHRRARGVRYVGNVRRITFGDVIIGE